MQLMHQKQISQSKALENLVARIPVKERQKLVMSGPVRIRSRRNKDSWFHQSRLDLEIFTYWLLSKYAQTRRKQGANKAEM